MKKLLFILFAISLVAMAWAQVANDTCETAEVVDEVTDLPFDTAIATPSGFGGYISSNDIWYVYTASYDGSLYVGLCESGFDTKLAIYGECDVTTVIATNDDSCGLMSELNIDVVVDEDYYIQVGGYGSNSGTGLLDVDFTSSFVYDPPVDLFVDNDGYATWGIPTGPATPLYSQMDNVGADGSINCQQYETDLAIYNCEGADDFVVPSGETWTINEVDVLGNGGGGNCDYANVRIYADDAGMPGTLQFEYLDVYTNNDVDGDLFCVIPDTPLAEGTYWISVQAHMNYNPNGQWYWQRQAPPLIGSEYHWRNPNGGYGGLIEWGPASVQWPAQTDYDLSFALYGTMATDSGKSAVFNNTDRSINNDMVNNTFKKINVPVSADLASADLKISTENVDNSRDLLGYNVYIDGAFIEYTTELFYDYDDGTLNDGETYLASVSAVYDDGESDLVNYIFVYGTPLVLTLPVEEGFEGGVLPDGWINEYVVASADWQYTYGVNGNHPNVPHNGSFNAYFNDNTGRTTKLVTPQIDLGAASNVTLSFWQVRQLYAPDVDYLRVYYKNSTAGSWVLLAEYLEPMEVWTEAVLGLPELSSEYYLAFEAEDGWGRGLGLDDVSLTGDISYPEISVTPTSINEILDPEGIVVIPVTIENTGGIDLTYDISIVETSDAYDRSKMSANNLTKASENINLSDLDIAPQGLIKNDPPASDALFDLQFQHYCGNLGQGGIETDGNYYYAPEYSGAEINRYDMDGNWLVAFTIPGVAEVRDLAFDGEYFYGAAVNTSLFQMDFTPGAETLISTTTIPVNCRGIAYDDDVDGFWVNNWGDDITLIDRNGAVLNSFSSGTFQSYYGLAYDNFSEGGPYLWGTAQVGPYDGVGFLVQFDIATGLETGVIYDLNDVPSCTSAVGGLFIADGLEFGYVTIGYMVQGQYIVGLELCPSEDAWMTIVPTTGTVPPGTSVVVDVTLLAEDLSDITKTADIVIANNAGNDVIIDVTMEVLPGEELDPPSNLLVTEEGYATWDAPTGGGGAVDFSIVLTDDYGDGWNGGLLDLAVNGTVVLDDITIATGAGPETFAFSVADGDFVEIYFTAGGWSYECAYFVYDNNASLVVSSGDGGVEPDAYLSFDAVVADDFVKTVNEAKIAAGSNDSAHNKLKTKAHNNTRNELEMNASDYTRDLLGYNVYLDSGTAVFVTDLFYQFTGLVDGQEYLAEVTAVYDEGESIPIEYTFIYEDGGIAFNPPENVVVDDELGTVSWLAPTTPIIEENIDVYAVGDYIGVVSPDFTTWSGTPGGADDSLVSDVIANSAPNSVVVEANQDLVLIMNDYTTGVYSYDMKMYVPSGFCGYFNLQKTSTPGQEWAFQIYYQTNGEAVADAGAEAALTHPFNHDEWMDLKVIVDLDNDLATYYFNGEAMITYQWTLGTFGTAGLLQFGGVNIFGGANAAQPTDVPMFYFDDIVLSEVSDEITGYNVYLDGVLDTTVGEEVYDFTYEGLTPLDSYTAGVSALYAGDESEIIEVGFIYDPVTTFDPPNNLAAEVVNYNDVMLTWELPGGATEELLYHTGYDANGIGTGAPADFICAARFTADELAAYYGGWEITGVNIFLHSMDFSYVGIQVYEGGSYGNPGTLVYDQDVTASAVALEWTNHLLTTPVPLAVGNEYWLAYDIQATGDHPAAVDAGPMFPDKGAWMFFSGAWQTLPELGATLDFNWIITGIVSESDAIATNKTSQLSKVTQQVIGREHTSQYMNNKPLKAEFTRSIRREATNPATSNSRSLSSYMIYKDGVELMEITDPATLTYTDNALDAGTYEYTITAIYTNPDGVSELTGPVEATVALDPPINVTAQSQTPNIIVTWDAPARDISAYNVYRDGEIISEGETGTMYIDVAVPTGEYIYNVTTIFDGDYESALSEDAPVSHTNGDGILKPTVTALTGNYPNPFNPTTTISFSLAEAGKVSINIYNMRGQLVKTLVNTELENAYHEIVWNGKDNSGKNTASGVYFYKMKASNYTATKKMILMK